MAGRFTPAQKAKMPRNQPAAKTAPRKQTLTGAGGPPQSAASQADALENPVTASTGVNPMQKQAFGDAAKFEDSIAAGTNLETQRELSRQRDQISAGMEAEGGEAIARGADPALFRSRAQAEGARNLASLQGDLAGVALDKHQAAIDSEGRIGTDSANTQNALHLGTLAAQDASQRTAIEQAESQSRIDQAPYDQALKMMETVGSTASAFGGGSSSSGGFVGSAPQPKGVGGAAGPPNGGRTSTFNSMFSRG